MFVLGYVFTRRHIFITADLLWTWFFIATAIFFAGLFSLATNNLADYEIDKISNKARPLVSQRIKRQDYIRLSWIFLAAALFYASAVNFIVFFIISLFIGNYFLYSMPPLRLKRVPFFSKLFISVNSLALFILGCLSTGSFRIPERVIVFFLLYFTPAINFIDIKDYEGDKLNGIKTLPVILGLRKSKFIIGIFFLLSYAAVCSIAPGALVLNLSLLFGLLMFLLINRKNYHEKPVLITYLSSLLIFIIYLLKY
jgi:4-hydroxybenzoate polyprenyltransferase